jgi:uncharacterized membrane protein
MPSAERTVTINRPAADVFAFLADGNNATKWRSVLDTKRISGSGVGAKYSQGVRGPMGRRIAADYEITAHEPGKRLEFKAIAGPVRPTGGYKFAEASGKTSVTFWLKADLGGWKRFVLGRSVQSTMNSEMKALDKLKEVLEGTGAKASAGTSKSSSAAASKSAASVSAPASSSRGKGTAARSAPAKAAPTRTARRKPKAS